MSSTNRGNKRSEADAYPTARWVVDRLLDRVDLPRGQWLEPCAGDGAIIRSVNAHPLYQTGIKWHASELRRRMEPVLVPLVGRPQVKIGDFLDPALHGSSYYDVVITNPPFRIAFEILQAAMRVSMNVVLLLRLNFFGSAIRHPFLREHMPKDVYVLPNRPAFKDDRKTDSIEYAWFHWAEPYGRKHSQTHLLDLTSREERRIPHAPIEYPDVG